MDIARYAIKTPVNTWLLILTLLLGGIIGLNKIPRLEDPAFTIKQVMITTAYPGASAIKVEKEITEPVETTIQQMPQLLKLESISKPGISEITAHIKYQYDGDDLPQIWDELRKRLGDMASSLPLGAQPPEVHDSFGDVYGLFYALIAPDFSPQELREFSRVIRRSLLLVPGVAKVEVNGVRQEQIVAEIKPEQLSNLGMALPDMVQLLRNQLKPFSSARLMVDGYQVRLPVAAASNQIEELANLAFVVPGSGTSIRVRDIAQLSVQAKDIQPNLIRHQSSPAITLAVAASNGSNIVEVGRAVNARIDELLTTLPAGISLSPIYNQADVVDVAVAGFIQNLEMSLLVVTLTLCVFMGWRSGVVVGAVLLLTVMGTLMLMWLSGLQLQRISLGAMVIAMGMLVDNAIVVAEGMMLRVKQGKSAIEAASFIVKRTQWPLLGATVIGIAAFSGIGLSPDSTGEFLFSLFAVVMISLLLSWLLAVTVVPLFGSYFYRPSLEPVAESDSVFHRLYTRVLKSSLTYRWLSLAVLLLITVSSYASFGLVKQALFAPSDTPLFFVHYWGPQGRDVRSTEQQMIAAEKVLLTHPEVVSVSSFVGRSASRFMLTYAPQAPNESYGLFLINLQHSKQIEGFAKTVIPQLQQLDPDAELYVKRLQFAAPPGAALEARFHGPDSEALRNLANKALALYREDGRLQDIRHNWRQKGLSLVAEYDAYQGGLSGVSRSDFADALQYNSSGLELGKYRQGDYSYPIVAKLPGTASPKTTDLFSGQVWSSQQRRYVPLQQVMTEARLESEEVLIHRRNRHRSISAFAEPHPNETPATALARVRPQIEAIPLPEGYWLEWGGTYEIAQEASEGLGKGLPLSFLVMFLVTVLLFGKARQPLIIWLIVPMALVGVVAGLLATNMPFGFMGLLGFLSLFGMLIKNAIVLLEEIDQQILEGKQERVAIVDASVSRLRPVSLAAITTILGMAPLITDAFFADMSVTIMGGLAFATVLTLIAVPVLYSLFYRVSFRQENKTNTSRFGDNIKTEIDVNVNVN